MDPIGGFFELELPQRRRFPHDDGVLLNSGRNALEYVLLSLGNVSNVFVPYYTCDVVLESVLKLGIPYNFYHINQNLELAELPLLRSGEYLIYTNYFGIKDEYVRKLVYHYGSQLIIDNAQAWFTEPIRGANTIYSPRKFVGLPDGGIAFCPKTIDENAFEQDYSFERCSHLLKRIDMGPSESYISFKENSKLLENQPVKRVSKLTLRLLSSINYEVVKNKRRKNFEYLHECLVKNNNFKIPPMESFVCPMVYPFLTEDLALRQKLIENKVFVATYWPNVSEWTKQGMLEYELSERLIPLPIDQRYGIDAMKTIISIIS